MQANQRFLELWQGYLAENLPPDELKELLVLMKDPQVFTEEIVGHVLENPPAQSVSAETGDLIFRELVTRMRAEETPARLSAMNRGWLWLAAATLVLLAGGLIWSITGKREQPSITLQEFEGKKDQHWNSPILTLANGVQVKLDSVSAGILSQQYGSAVILSNGNLRYQAASSGPQKGDNIFYNKLATPKGKQFKVLLPDGSMAWLNAASSIRYPTTFTGNERTVEITGEVYLEVAANPSQPFVVRFPVNGMEKTGMVQVLGTHFNINAYDDEAVVKTTLVKGSVRVVLQKGNATKDNNNKDNVSNILRPGQQATIVNISTQPSNAIIIRENVDMEKVLAWKNEVFDFHDTDLGDVMRQLSRWYDFTVIYESGVPPIRFNGELGRDLSMEQILEVLKASRVHFRLEENRKLVITP